MLRDQSPHSANPNRQRVLNKNLNTRLLIFSQIKSVCNRMALSIFLQIYLKSLPLLVSVALIVHLISYTLACLFLYPSVFCLPAALSAFFVSSMFYILVQNHTCCSWNFFTSNSAVIMESEPRVDEAC